MIPKISQNSLYCIGPKLVATNFPPQIAVSKIKQIFSVCGNVVDINQTVGWNFKNSIVSVTFGQIAEAVKAIHMLNQTEQFGRIVYVTFAKKQPPNPECTCTCHQTDKNRMVQNKKKAKQAKPNMKQSQKSIKNKIHYEVSSKDKEDLNDNFTEISSRSVFQVSISDDFYSYQGKPFSDFHIKTEED